MIFDQQSIFSDAQALTATAASTNVLDITGAVGTPPHAAAALDVDVGRADCRIGFTIDETFVSAGASTLSIALQVDTAAAFGSATALWTSSAIAKATLVKGYMFEELVILPRGITERYLRLYYTVGTADFTAGKITAGFVWGQQTNS